jgi:phosphatidate cytidylyltransferase
VYLIVFTECHDIFQALWGRRFGRHKLTPQVSPHKTWEGFVLGGLTVLAIGILLAPVLTPLAEPWSLQLGTHVWRIPYVGALAAGGILILAGVMGDLNISALKRDAAVKDTGTWLPTQGGILDRVNSLTFTAPAFYYFVRVIYD